MRPYKPHPFGPDDRPRSDAVQSMTWRARRDACRPACEIAAMSPARRERALAVRAAAAAMLTDAMTTPCGHIEALRVRLAVPRGGDLRDDWAERHRQRERERMRRRREAADPKLTDERERGRQQERTPEGRAKRARWDAARYAAKKAWRAAAAHEAGAARAAEVAAALAELQSALAEAEVIAARGGNREG